MAKDQPKLGKLAKTLVRKREPVGRSRRRANRIAANILRGEKFVTSNHVLACLENWNFHKNTTRRNVYPNDDTAFIWSDTLGLVSTRDSKRIVLTKAVLAYPPFFILGRQLRQQDYATSARHLSESRVGGWGCSLRSSILSTDCGDPGGGGVNRSRTPIHDSVLPFHRR